MRTLDRVRPPFSLATASFSDFDGVVQFARGCNPLRWRLQLEDLFELSGGCFAAAHGIQGGCQVVANEWIIVFGDGLSQIA